MVTKMKMWEKHVAMIMGKHVAILDFFKIFNENVELP